MKTLKRKQIEKINYFVPQGARLNHSAKQRILLI